MHLSTSPWMPLLAALLALPSLPTAARAWPHGPTTNTPLHQNFSATETIVSASDGAGGAIFAWADQRNGNWDIFAQRLDASGTRLWGNNGVAVCTDAGEQRSPVIAAIPQGGVVIGWVDRRLGSADLFAQRVSATGSPQWAANGVVVVSIPGPNEEIAPAIAYQFDGVYFVWQDGAPGSWNVYAQRLNLGGSPQYAVGGLSVCSSSGDQTDPRIAVTGGSSLGFMVTWTDGRAGAATDIYAQFFSINGSPLGSANGFGVCTAAGIQSSALPVTIAGSYWAVAWRDERSGVDLYGQKYFISSREWATDGVPLLTGTTEPLPVGIAADDAGGFYVGCLDASTIGFTGYRMQRVSPLGAALWGATGSVVSADLNGDARPRLLGDGVGGVLTWWSDNRTYAAAELWADRRAPGGASLWGGGVRVSAASTPNRYVGSAASDGAGGMIIGFQQQLQNEALAKRVDRWGMTGAEPRITSVQDVANDQGGAVRVSWDASPLDVDPAFENIEEYWLLREAPAGVAAALRARGVRILRAGDAAPPAGARALVAVEGTDAAWEFVRAMPAAHLASYSAVAATTTDSSAAGNPLTRFLVQARAAGGAGWWESNPDSGYSVDDLAPAMPAPFAGTFVAGTGSFLNWGANLETDLAGYRLYRGSSVSFVPGPGSLVAALTATHFEDPAGGPVYKLSAVDVHGNESPFATLTPAGIVDVAAAPLPDRLTLSPVSPNPAGGPVAIAYALPRPATVRLSVLDAQGRLVRLLVSEPREAGRWSTTWDGRDAAGRPCGNGLYWLRVEAGGEVRTTRFIRLR